MALKAQHASIQVSALGRAERTKVTLEVQSSTGRNGMTAATIHNISATGLLIETSALLEMGEHIDIALPYGGVRTAAVVWVNDDLFGCKFEEPIPAASISAALLRSPVRAPPEHKLSGEHSGLEDAPQRKYPLWVRGWTIILVSLFLWTLIVLGLQRFALNWVR